MSPARLDPQAQALLDVMRASGARQPYELPLEQARARMRSAFISRGQPIEMHDVHDVTLPTPSGPLGLRVYRPTPQALPLALFLHGGGWALNDLDTHDRLCRLLARRSGMTFASLDFRRAPEHRHPAALEDALVAYRWLLDNAEQVGAKSAGVAVVGESSGGATAAGLTLLLRDLRAPLPLAQALAYPVVDGSDHWPSYSEHGEGYTLDRDFVRWSLESYLPIGYRIGAPDPYLFASSAPDLCGLPATVMLTAEFDPLRDGAVAYADKLAAAGVAVEHIHAEDQMHGFMLLDRAVTKAGALIDRFAEALAAACHSG